MRASRSPRAMRLRGARQAVHRIGDPLRHRIAEAGAGEDEQQRRKQRATIERVELIVDVALPGRQRHRQDPELADSERRGGDEILEVADSLPRHGRRFVAQREGVIDVGVHARRQQARMRRDCARW